MTVSLCLIATDALTESGDRRLPERDPQVKGICQSILKEYMEETGWVELTLLGAGKSHSQWFDELVRSKIFATNSEKIADFMSQIFSSTKIDDMPRYQVVTLYPGYATETGSIVFNTDLDIDAMAAAMDDNFEIAGDFPESPPAERLDLSAFSSERPWVLYLRPGSEDMESPPAMAAYIQSITVLRQRFPNAVVLVTTRPQASMNAELEQLGAIILDR